MSSEKSFKLDDDLFTLDGSHEDDGSSVNKENSSGPTETDAVSKQVLKPEPLRTSPGNSTIEDKTAGSESDEDILFLGSVPSKYITISGSPPSVAPPKSAQTGITAEKFREAIAMAKASTKADEGKRSVCKRSWKGDIRKPTRGPDGVMGHDLGYTDDSETDYDPDEVFESSSGDDDIVDTRPVHKIPVSKELDYIELLERRLSRRIKKEKKAKMGIHVKSCGCALCKPNRHRSHDDDFGNGGTGNGGGSSLAY